MLKTLSLAFAFGLAALSPAFAAPEIGKPAPDFQTTDITGKPQSVSQYKGNIVVLEWTNPECPFVKKHYGSGNMQALQQYAKSKDVVWIKINSGAPGKQGHLTPEKAAASLKAANSEPTAYILDPEGKIGISYEAKTTPHMFIIDREGTLAYMGAIDDRPTFDPADIEGARNYVREALDALLAGGQVETASTKPYGCGVKY